MGQTPTVAELQRLQYDYHVTAATENNGNPRVHRATHGGTTYTHTYGFDTANRLKSMKETSIGGALAIDQLYGFDAYNNMWTTSPNGTIAAAAYTPQAPEAFNTATNRFSSVMGDEYDDAGHTTVAEQGAITSVWDSEGRRIKATYQSFKPTTFVFDGLGQRVKKANEDWGEYVYVFDAFGRLAAEYGPGINGECSVCYPFADAVGSTRMVADASGNAVQRFDFSGFGTGITTTWSWTNGRNGLWDDASAVKQQWGGHYRDDMPWEGGMEFFGARAYKRPYGRFLSPDENLVDQDPGDPLSWNLFAYARNNPVRYGDADGRKCVEGKDDETGNDCIDVKGTIEKVKAVSTEVTGKLAVASLRTLLTINEVGSKVAEAVYEWGGRPRDPGCMATLSGIGGTGGFIAGGGLGLLGFAAGPTGMASTPAGAAAGASAGGAIGYAGGMVMCSSGTGNGGGGDTTKHGAHQMEVRKVTDAEKAQVKTGQRFTQPDGATVFVKKLDSGRYNVLVEGDGGVVTFIKNKTRAEVNALARNYEWR